jgi:hypothetical protein
MGGVTTRYKRTKSNISDFLAFGVPLFSRMCLPFACVHARYVPCRSASFHPDPRVQLRQAFRGAAS